MCYTEEGLMKLWKSVSIFLILNAAIFAKDYKGAELYSTEAIKYGKFEFRMKAVYGGGILSTFFLYYNDSYLGNPEPWREIDLEVIGKINNGFQSNIITGNSANKNTSEEMHTFNSVLSEEYHTYAIEWTPDYIAWFFDSEEVRRSTGAQVTDCRDKDQSYRFNLWISSVVSWAGAFNKEILPVYQYINWMEYSSYTPGQGPDGSDFTFKWRDDFDNFNSSRWAKGDWTFEDNLVDFDPKNIVVKEGYMILCLTNSQTSGHSGSVPLDEASPIKKSSAHDVNRSNFQVVNMYPKLQLCIQKRQSIQIDFLSLQGKKLCSADLGFKNPGTHFFNVSDYMKTSVPSAVIVRIGNDKTNKNVLMLNHFSK